MEHIRTFIAVELTEEIKRNLGKIQEELKKTNAKVKWVSPGNIHLTLRFLGFVPVDQIPGIGDELKKGLSGFGPFWIEVAKLGSFPPKGRPKVIWAGVSAGSEDVIKLQGKIEDFLKKFNFEQEDRRYIPHLTIGRVKSPKNTERLQELMRTKNSVQFGNMTVGDVSIIRSDLKPEGPVYTVLEKIAL